MTTDELVKLDAITSRIRELLDIAEKRTLGRWQRQDIAGSSYVSVGNKLTGEGYRLICCVTTQTHYQADANGDFIASAAGNFEAALRTTMGDIETFTQLLRMCQSTSAGKNIIESRLRAIITEWEAWV